ncbi:hypothetical protein ASAC_0679 [Acidilobus saccharovorans 345-15]|uniref:Uncharacterized protein n=1 Tax=Acidilobus saccharovorans (strain DSM 16705 / JCM 18335 / VKM B-2471 / 345-15) TaxID=666510 RepID=D9Q197_ACIS3|nr:hypothetical protein ASAC_0679 [Acidilobus saccharovorans 345-15]
MAAAIITIYNDSGLAYKLGLKGRDGVYTWNQVTDKLLSLYAAGKA